MSVMKHDLVNSGRKLRYDVYMMTDELIIMQSTLLYCLRLISLGISEHDEVSVYQYLLLLYFTWAEGLSETTSLSSQGRGKAAYTLPSPNPTCEVITLSLLLLLMMMTYRLDT